MVDDVGDDEAKGVGGEAFALVEAVGLVVEAVGGADLDEGGGGKVVIGKEVEAELVIERVAGGEGVDGAGAVTLLRQALRLRPDEPSIATLDHLGDALWRDGDQSGAVRCWQEVGRVARLRHPPDATRNAIAAFQLREYGVVVADPAEVAQRQFGRTVERAERKLREVAEGRPPAVAELPAAGVRSGE